MKLQVLTLQLVSKKTKLIYSKTLHLRGGFFIFMYKIILHENFRSNRIVQRPTVGPNN